MKRFVFWFAWTALSLLAGAAIMATIQSADAQTTCAPSAADQAHVCWINATKDETGAALPTTGPDALKETRVFIGTCSAAGVFGTQIGSAVIVAMPATDHLFTGLAPGVYCFRARHVTNAGVFSGYSNTASKTTNAPAPKKSANPSGLAVA